MKVGSLSFQPAQEQPTLLGKTVHQAVQALTQPDAWVAPIDASLADTAAFCEHYQVGLDISANCVVVEARRADRTWYAACLILATTKADVNGAVRRQLDARKISFAPMDTAVQLSNMEYGGITPVGLPAGWPILIDEQIMRHERVIIGSGIRGSKLYVGTKLLAELPSAIVGPFTKL